MGLTAQSTGSRAAVCAARPQGKVVALAGNPNVGKSTVFNSLTGMHQHTGNWSGKTVATAFGKFKLKEGEICTLADLPGTYSLIPRSAEEAVARDFLCFGQPDAVVVVCDGGAMERNLSLVLQAAEITDKLVVCVNLIDQAEKRGVDIDAEKLSAALGVPVVKTAAGSGKGIRELKSAIASVCQSEKRGSNCRRACASVSYPADINIALEKLEPILRETVPQLSARWLALRLLEQDESALSLVREHCGFDPLANPAVSAALEKQREILTQKGFDRERISSSVAACQIMTAESICDDCVTVRRSEKPPDSLDRRLDKLFTGKVTGTLFMLLLMALIFWLTIAGANYPSEWLSRLFAAGEAPLREFLLCVNAPSWLVGLLVDGIYCVLTWIISVMLPPMAIFFPLFTLLEDSGYLPRVAFNLDDAFRRCGTCGKQALTTCMGFGCNAVGVSGSRIIDSPRERLIAIITNSFIPCNGRFPMLVTIISMFLLGGVVAPLDSILSALLLTALILLGVMMTFAVSKALSSTVLRGMPSSFALELPPYRKPRIASVIVRSIFDRTIFVLGRAVAVAAPAGALIWLMANVNIGDRSLLATFDSALEPFGQLLGMDGVIIMAFILGFPANEIVIPLIIMSYMAEGRLVEINDLSAMRELLVANGWTMHTAICTMLFSLMHWPCSTTCITIYHETKSMKWTAAAIFIPTAAGMLICAVAAAVLRAFGL